jgi:hypothetical protein
VRRRVLPFRNVAAAAVLGAACATAGAASAEEPETAPAPRMVVFGSIEGARSAYGSIGAKRTLSGSLDETGPVAMITAGARGSPDQLGILRSEAAAFRPAFAGSALLGYQWALGRTFLSLFAGPELDRDRFWSKAGVARVATRTGARLQAEVWIHPTESTLLTGTAVAGSARGSLWARASAGYKVWREVFVGPEATHYRSDGYREWRLGAHATGLQLWRFNLRLSGGWLTDNSTTRGGAYGTLSAYVKM